MHRGSWNTSETTSLPQSGLRKPRYCEVLPDEDDHTNPFFCPHELSDKEHRFCARHQKQRRESLAKYKAASHRADALLPRVNEIRRKKETGKPLSITELREAITTTDEYIYWATEELKERRSHARRFYAYGAPASSPQSPIIVRDGGRTVPSNSGHKLRMSNLEMHIRQARQLRSYLQRSLYGIEAEETKQKPEESETTMLARNGNDSQQQLRSSPQQQVSAMNIDPLNRAKRPCSPTSSQISSPLRRKHSTLRLTGRPSIRRTRSQTRVRSWTAPRRYAGVARGVYLPASGSRTDMEQTADADAPADTYISVALPAHPERAASI